jgi:hypothetical protein
MKGKRGSEIREGGGHQPQPASLEQEDEEVAGVHVESGGRMMEERGPSDGMSDESASWLTSMEETAAATAALDDVTSVSTMTDPARTATMRI